MKRLYVVTNDRNQASNENGSDDTVSLEFEASQDHEECSDVVEKMEKEIASSSELRKIMFIGFVGLFLGAVSIFFAIILI